MHPALVRAALLGALLALPSVATADLPSASDADLAIDAADRAARRLLALLDQTRRARDVSRISCVDRKLSQVNSIARTLTDRRQRLREATARGDAAEVAHQRRVVRSLVAQLREAERAGRACVYPEANVENRTVETVTIDPSIRHRDLSLPVSRP